MGQGPQIQTPCALLRKHNRNRVRSSVLAYLRLSWRRLLTPCTLVDNYDETIYKLPTWCTDYYLFIKYYFSLHVSSLKCSSSGGYSCIHVAYGTVTLYECSWWSVGTQLEFSLKLYTDRPLRTPVESNIAVCRMYTTVSSWRWALEARNM